MKHHCLAIVALLLAISVAMGRIPPAQRKFSSPVIESVINRFVSQLKDPELAKIFENCFPNCLDTTVSSYEVNPTTGVPSTFIITGDIDATWYVSLFLRTFRWGSSDSFGCLQFS